MSARMIDWPSGGGMGLWQLCAEKFAVMAALFFAHSPRLSFWGLWRCAARGSFSAVGGIRFCFSPIVSSARSCANLVGIVPYRELAEDNNNSEEI